MKMTTNRKWVEQAELSRMRSSDGSIWLCKVCKCAMPYDEDLDNEEVRKTQQHKRPRHHYVYAIRIPEMVKIGAPGMYTIDGVRERSEADIIAEYRERIQEKYIIADARWIERLAMVEKYKTTDVSISYYMCDACYKITECDVQDIHRVYHCDKLATIHNENFKRWFDNLAIQ